MPINHYACTENHLNADHLINIICCVVFSAVGLVVVVVVDFTACLVLTEAEIACNEINEWIYVVLQATEYNAQCDIRQLKLVYSAKPNAWMEADNWI